MTYDPLLDEYEPGATTAELAVVFESLRRELVPLVASIAEAIKRRPVRSGPPILTRLYPRDRQKVFGEAAAAAVGFDFDRGRLDVAAHPFCTGIGPGDCRITTRYDEHQFSDAFFGVLHEVGHALYEQGLDSAHYGTPMGEAVSLGVHESQSRLWENAVGRGRPFWTYWFPMAKRVFHEALNDVSLDDFHAAINHVEPSLIRVQADEATYNLHIIVRFELEQALLSGALSPADLPAAWNQKYTETLGVTPRTDAEGCLQDIHWSAGPDRLFSHLHPGQCLCRPALRQGPVRPDRPGRFLRPRRLRPPAHVAPRQGPPPRPARPLGRPDRARHRLSPRPPATDRQPETEILRAIRCLIERTTDKSKYNTSNHGKHGLHGKIK